MERDRDKWNRKYQDNPVLKPALSMIETHLHLVSGRRALDLACGLGRNSLFLADRGFEVDAVDISDVALAGLNHERVNPVRADLDDYQIAMDRYDLILNTYFLDRNLVNPMIQGLRKGGVLMFETYLADSTQINNPQFKLAPGELLELFGTLETCFYVEADHTATLIAKKTEKD